MAPPSERHVRLIEEVGRLVGRLFSNDCPTQ